ncbi:MAG: transposase [Oscillospiraceae bacterium]|nr:transposase [Oscillospiraceae bacterium]
MINSFIPAKCPFCASGKFKRSGQTGSGVQRYMCICGKTFLPTTGTIFDGHRISISEWMEYCLNLFRHVSIAADSWNNKNAFTTSRYWLRKLFLTLENVQDSVVLSDEVWLDETFYRVRSEGVVRNADGTKLRGLSGNQICIGVATDKKNTLLLVEGTGKPSQKKTVETFVSHIAPGSTLIHDKDNAHKKLVRDLSLVNIAYASKDLKGLPDKDNPMNPVNQVHNILKKFLNAHSGFDRANLQGFLNLLAFVSNPPVDLLEKVALVVEMGFQNPKLLRYRDLFAMHEGIEL